MHRNTSKFNGTPEKWSVYIQDKLLIIIITLLLFVQCSPQVDMIPQVIKELFEDNYYY